MENGSDPPLKYGKFHTFFSTLKASLRTHPFYNWADVTVQTDYRLQTVSICNLPWFKMINYTTHGKANSPISGEF